MYHFILKDVKVYSLGQTLLNENWITQKKNSDSQMLIQYFFSSSRESLSPERKRGREKKRLGSEKSESVALKKKTWEIYSKNAAFRD